LGAQIFGHIYAQTPSIDKQDLKSTIFFFDKNSWETLQLL